MTDDAAAMSLDELRERRRVLQQLDDAVSYVRRVAQGRADLARAELARRVSGADAPELADDLRHVLGDRLLGASDRPPRPADDFSDDPRAEELDRLCAERGFGRLSELDDGAVAELAAALDVFEGEVSDERHRVFAELDDLSEELVRRYREQRQPGDPDE
jgi:RsiG-like